MSHPIRSGGTSSSSSSLEEGSLLHLSNDFPGGNGATTLRVATGQRPTVVELSAESRGSSIPLWFHVQMAGLASEPFELRLANALQLNGDHRAWPGNTIVMRDGKQLWRRSGLPIVDQDEAGIERVTYPMRFESNQCEVAWCFPYQHEQLRQVITQCPQWRAARIGRSAEGRLLERYRYIDPDNPTASDATGRPTVYIIARQHAGETPASWVLDGIMRSAAVTEIGQSVARQLDLWVVPFVDPDGAIAGRYGRRGRPTDFSHAWTSPAQATEIAAVMLDIKRCIERRTPVLFIELEATTHAERDSYFIVPSVDHPSYSDSRLVVDAYREALPEELMTDRFVVASRDNGRSRPGSTASWVRQHLDCPAMSLRVSYQGTPNLDFAPEDYHRLGHALLSACTAALS